MSAKGDGKSWYGVAEWYGELFKSLGRSERQQFLSAQNDGSPIECRFMRDSPELAPKKGPYCNKASGVCSIRRFIDTSSEIDFGPITTTCPYRFLEDGLVIREIGKALLGTDSPIVIKEVPFLKRVRSKVSESEGEGFAKQDVGKIDMVCVHPNKDPLVWCAVEMQAVYFSGGKIEKDFTALRGYDGNGVPMPAVRRSPDFRSSGPKRLMPQLQIKVPTLRRWGKKMAIIVDQPFFEAMGPIISETDVSNADIAWMVMSYSDEGTFGKAKMFLKEIRYCTLERAVEGLTAGVPATLDEFEQRLRSRIRS